MKNSIYKHPVTMLFAITALNLFQSNPLAAQEKNTKPVKAIRKFSIGIDVFKSQPHGEFLQMTSGYGTKVGKYIQGGSMNIGMDINNKWSISISPITLSLYYVNPEFFRSAAGPAYPKFDWYGWGSHWKATQTTLQLNRDIRLFNSNKLYLQVGLIAGRITMSTNFSNAADGYSFLFWSAPSQKFISLQNARATSLVAGINTNLSIHISKRYELCLGIDSRISRLKFKDVVLVYVNNNEDDPEPPSFENKFSFKQTYTATNFKVGLNYRFNLKN